MSKSLREKLIELDTSNIDRILDIVEDHYKEQKEEPKLPEEINLSSFPFEQGSLEWSVQKVGITVNDLIRFLKSKEV